MRRTLQRTRDICWRRGQHEFRRRGGLQSARRSSPADLIAQCCGKVRFKRRDPPGPSDCLLRAQCQFSEVSRSRAVAYGTLSCNLFVVTTVTTQRDGLAAISHRADQSRDQRPLDRQRRSFVPVFGVTGSDVPGLDLLSRTFSCDPNSRGTQYKSTTDAGYRQNLKQRFRGPCEKQVAVLGISIAPWVHS